MSQADTIKAALAELIAEARQKKLWLYVSYQSMWFSPDDLERENARGHFLWAPGNWRLRDPAEGLADIDRRAENIAEERRRFVARMGK